MAEVAVSAHSRRTARRWPVPAGLLGAVVVALASFATAIVQTVSAGEQQFQAQQRLLARQLADRIAETLRRAEVAAATLALSDLPSDRQTADRWLERMTTAYRLDDFVELRVESSDHRLLAVAGQPRLDHEHHGSGLILCPRCLAEDRALAVRGRRDPAGRQVEVRLSLLDLGSRIVGPAVARRASAGRLVDRSGRVLASGTGRDIGSWAPATSVERWIVSRARVPASGKGLEVVLSASSWEATRGVRRAVAAELVTAVLLLVVLAGAAAFVRRREKASLEARMAAERAAAEADRLATIGVLASGTMHEINNPLACITANLEFAAGAAGGDPATAEAIADARDCAARIAVIVGDLKAFARRPDDTLELVDTRKSLEAALRMARYQTARKARVTAELGEVPPVKADPSRLAQVFLNLLVNAAQALPDGAAQDNEIRATLQAVDGRVVAEIADTGPGMTPEVASRVFEPFFTTKPRGAGTGLGLAICRSIVTGFGGEISVASELGRGAAFRVAIPTG